MYIEKIKINSFGKLHDKTIELRPGINVLEGENESGKSTIAAFIVFILYGMKSSSVRTRYISWNESSSSGSLTVVTGKGRILIERSAVITGSKDAVRESVRMTVTETGLEIHKGQCPGEALFGVPEDVFLSTAFVRQLSGARFDGEKMSAAAENLLFSADEAVNTEKAAEKIDAMRRQLLHKNGKGGAIYEKEQQLAQLTSRLEAAKQSSGELINVEAAITDLTEKRDTAIERRERAREKARNYETLENLRRFDRLVALKDSVAGLYAEKDELLAQNMSSSGHFPDSKYIGELHAVSDGMAATSASIASVSRQLDGLRDEASKCPNRELYSRLTEEDDAADEIVSDVESTSSRRTTSAIMAVLTFVFAAVCAGLAFYFRERGQLYTISLFSASGVFAAAAVVSFIVSVTSGVRLRRDLRYYGADTADVLRDRIEQIKEDAEQFRRIDEDIASSEAELYVQYSVYDDEVREARELLAQRGIEAGGDDELAEALNEALDRCEELYDRDCDIEEEINRERAEIGELERQLSGVSEDEVRSDAEFINAAEVGAINAADLKREREFTENAVLRLTEGIHELEIRRAQLTASRDDPAALAVAIDNISRELEADRSRFEACILAIEALFAAGRGVRASVAPSLRESARAYMGKISGGRYDELGVNASFGMTIFADGAYRGLDSMSGGTVDAAYLSLRLSLVRLLFRRELPPLIFDESFSQMDDARTRSMLDIISGDGEPQSLILSCQGRESRMCPDANKIVLG